MKVTKGPLSVEELIPESGRQAQMLTDHFWRRWLREYVPALTEWRKWRTRSQTDAQIGDLVLVAEDNLPRGRWNLGRIVKTFPGDDGLIRNKGHSLKW